jgi:hypothetical protein
MGHATAGMVRHTTMSSATLRRALARCAVLFALLAAGCASAPRPWLEQEGLTIAWQAKSTSGPELRDVRLAYPVDVTQAAVANQLRSLRYQPLQGVAAVQPVFVEDEVQRLAGPLRDALRQVSHLDLVHFRLRTATGPTAGEVFATQDHLHWRLAEIAGVPFAARSGGSEESRWDWRLVPGPGQSLFVPATPLRGKTVANWVVADFALPTAAGLPAVRLAPVLAPAPAASPPPAALPAPSAAAPAKPTAVVSPPAKPAAAPTPAAKKAPQPAPGVLEEKLETLKRLRDKRLIDKQEYDTRKRQLLDEYF